MEQTQGFVTICTHSNVDILLARSSSRFCSDLFHTLSAKRAQSLRHRYELWLASRLTVRIVNLYPARHQTL